MHDELFANHTALAPEDLQKHAQTVGLDTPQFVECLESGQVRSRVERNMIEARQAGVTSTPYFLIGLTKPESQQIEVLTVLRGAHPYANFKQAIERLLK